MAATPPRSPLAPCRFPDLPEIGGLRLACAEAGVRYRGRPDLMLAHLAPGTAVAGVFTRSATRSAAVLDCQAKLGGPSAAAAAIVVNSGNANAFTGRRGTAAVAAVVQATAEALQLPPARVFTASTGVIGEPLPHERITARIAALREALVPGAMADAARAIMTTDTFAKGSATEVQLGGQVIRIAGIAKGSGMIAPDMATMLAYIFTDAAVEQPVLQSLVTALNRTTFNCITVDSDTSTSDTLLVAATGTSGVRVTESSMGFMAGLRRVMLDLAHQVVRDGEGATKFVEVSVTGAASDAEAHVHAKAIANSPLVKTAVAGEDPNWGRVVMAVGKSGARADRDSLSIWFGDHQVARDGAVSPDHDEARAAAYMTRQDLTIHVDFGLGGGTAVVWTCDLTHGYIDINADYRS